jgi:inner membrane protein involved in colicin E2 resistance
MAWIILGGSVQYRTKTQDNELKQAVGQLWGTTQRQAAPVVYYQTSEVTKVKETVSTDQLKTIEKTETRVTNHPIPLEGSTLKVDLNLEHRRKGLLWYPTYRVGFNGRYVVKNTTDKAQNVFFAFTFPCQGAVYDDFTMTADGERVDDIEMATGCITRPVRLDPGKTSVIELAYRSQGMDEWWYVFGESVTQVRDFSLAMNTDFSKIDFPQNSVSPTKRVKTNAGWSLDWTYRSLLSGVQIGMVMPKKLNPGPWVSQVTYFAPVSLFLFFFLVFLFSTLRKIKLHPMHYFFLAAAFFSYHLLLAYLVDHISIHLAFWICSAVSIFLVISYMRIVAGHQFAFLEIGISQLVFLVAFSYTFFYQGYTGLTITVLCIITLFLVMQMTARLDWETAFKENR